MLQKLQRVRTVKPDRKAGGELNSQRRARKYETRLQQLEHDIDGARGARGAARIVEFERKGETVGADA